MAGVLTVLVCLSNATVMAAAVDAVGADHAEAAVVDAVGADHAETPVSAAASRAATETGDAAAVALGRKLRCPVCQGMPIAESPATMAVDMMQRVRQMQAAGRSDEAIIAYFTSRYGQWVLLDPPRTGFALWVWVLPPLAALGLLLLAGRILLRLRVSDRSVNLPHVQAPTSSALLTAVRQEVDQ